MPPARPAPPRPAPPTAGPPTAGPAHPTSPADPNRPPPAARRTPDAPARGGDTPDRRSVTAVDRLRWLYGPAGRTEFPALQPNGVGNPDTAGGWLTQMRDYVVTVHDRDRARRAKRPRALPPGAASPEPQRADPGGADDPPPF